MGELKLEKKSGNILVVDDDLGLRGAIAFDLQRKGYHVFQAANGREAFEIVKANQVDIVLSDVRMPGGDGVELLDKIKAHNPDIPVVMFITGFADIGLDTAYDKGADAVFSKPFDRKALFAAIESAMKKKDDRWSQRRAERVVTELNVNLKCGLQENLAASLVNIGRGGMFIAWTGPFPKVGEEVEFRLTFTGGSIAKLEGTGCVRWIRPTSADQKPSGCGVEFQYLTDESRSAVIQLINSAKTAAYIPK